MADCFAVCPTQIPADTANFDRNNCAGQHDGITINDLGGDLMYTWSDLNTALGGTPDGNIQFPPNSTSSSVTPPPLASDGPAGNKHPEVIPASNANPASTSPGTVNTNNGNPSNTNPATIPTNNTYPAGTTSASINTNNQIPASNAPVASVPSANSSRKQAASCFTLPTLSALGIVTITLPMLFALI